MWTWARMAYYPGNYYHSRLQHIGDYYSQGLFDVLSPHIQFDPYTTDSHYCDDEDHPMTGRCRAGCSFVVTVRCGLGRGWRITRGTTTTRVSSTSATTTPRASSVSCPPTSNSTRTPLIPTIAMTTTTHPTTVLAPRLSPPCRTRHRRRSHQPAQELHRVHRLRP